MNKALLFAAFLVLALMAASPSVLIKIIVYTDDIFFGVKNAIFAQIEVPETHASTVRFAGDVMLGRHVETLMSEYGVAFPYSRLETSSSTTWVGNFEAVVPKDHTQTPDFTMALSVDKEVLPALKAAGFSYVSLANNHSLDFGSDALRETREHLAMAGLTSFGDPTEVGSTSAALIETEGGTVGLVALHATDQYPDWWDLNLVMYELEKESDIQIAYVHWGTEYKDVHHQKQEEFAHTLVDMGFDAVVGHHPHVVQDIEMYRDRPIFYSLGNFIFDQYFDDRVMEGLVVELELIEGEAHYTLLSYTTKDMTAAPRLMTEAETDEFLANLADRSNGALAESIIKARILATYETNNLHLTHN